MPTRHRSALLSALLSLALIAPASAQGRAAARGADRPAAVLSRRQDEGRAAEAEAQPVHRAVSQDRFFHRPSRCGAAIPRAQPGILHRGGADGRRRDRMRRDVHKRPATGLPAFAMRPAHHDQYPVDAGACRKMHACRSFRPIPPPAARRPQNAAPATSRWPNSGRSPAKMDGFNPNATTAPNTRTARRAGAPTSTANSGTLMTHDESIALIKSLGAKFTPELKAPEVAMPFDGDYTQEKYASQMLRGLQGRRAFRPATCSPRVLVLPTSCIG